ncbi:MAG: hypothetical protein LBB09_02775, partial [Rickettsiales bacterium]|nr:hypothetical protein [Rickettsiales bacterium]
KKEKKKAAVGKATKTSLTITIDNKLIGPVKKNDNVAANSDEEVLENLAIFSSNFIASKNAVNLEELHNLEKKAKTQKGEALEELKKSIEIKKLTIICSLKSNKYNCLKNCFQIMKENDNPKQAAAQVKIFLKTMLTNFLDLSGDKDKNTKIDQPTQNNDEGIPEIIKELFDFFERRIKEVEEIGKDNNNNEKEKKERKGEGKENEDSLEKELLSIVDSVNDVVNSSSNIAEDIKNKAKMFTQKAQDRQKEEREKSNLLI